MRPCPSVEQTERDRATLGLNSCLIFGYSGLRSITLTFIRSTITYALQRRNISATKCPTVAQTFMRASGVISAKPWGGGKPDRWPFLSSLELSLPRGDTDIELSAVGSRPTFISNIHTFHIILMKVRSKTLSPLWQKSCFTLFFWGRGGPTLPTYPPNWHHWCVHPKFEMLAWRLCANFAAFFREIRWRLLKMRSLVCGACYCESGKNYSQRFFLSRYLAELSSSVAILTS